MVFGSSANQPINGEMRPGASANRAVSELVTPFGNAEMESDGGGAGPSQST